MSSSSLKFAVQNIKNVELICASHLNTLSLIKAKQVILTSQAINEITPKKHKMRLRSDAVTIQSKATRASQRSKRKGKKVVTGNTVPQKVTIFTDSDEGEDEHINLVSKNDGTIETQDTEPYFF